MERVTGDSGYGRFSYFRAISEGLSGRLLALAVRDVDRPAERHEPGFLDRLRQRRMGGHAVRHGLDGRLGVDRHHAGLDQVGHVRADHHEPEQFAVPRLVDRLDPTRGLVLHHRARIRDPREHARRHVVAVLLSRLCLGQTDTRDLGLRVDRSRHGTIVDHGVVAAGVLGRDLTLATRGVSELPVARAVTDRVDVLDGGAAVLVRSDAFALVELDADCFEAHPFDGRAAADGDEHEIGLDRLAVAEMYGQRASRVLYLPALLLEVKRDAALAELLRELLRRISVLLWDQRRQQLDDRHLTAEALEDRRELAADDAAAEHDEALRNLRLRKQPLGVDAALRIDTFDRGTKRERARRDDRLLEGDVLAAFDGERVRVLERAVPLDPVDAVRLEERSDALRHLLDDAVLPLVRLAEFELEATELHAQLVERVLGLFQRERSLHPGLRRDAPDAEARAAELGLALDAGDLRAELRSPDRGRITTWPPAENDNVDFHRDRSYRAATSRPSW